MVMYRYLMILIVGFPGQHGFFHSLTIDLPFLRMVTFHSYLHLLESDLLKDMLCWLQRRGCIWVDLSYGKKEMKPSSHVEVIGYRIRQ